MKIWQVIILAVLLVSLPALSACKALGLGGNDNEEELYRQQLEAYQQQREAYQKYREEYYQKLEEGLNQYMEAYQDYQDQQTQLQIQQSGGQAVIVTANQTQPQENGSE
jgi:ABC-type transporter lipoprotein component MlaA